MRRSGQSCFAVVQQLETGGFLLLHFFHFVDFVGTLPQSLVPRSRTSCTARFVFPLSYPVILDSKLVTSRLWSQHVIGDTTLFTAVTQLVMDLPCVCALLFGPRNDGGNGNEVTRSHAKGGLQTSLTQLQSNTPSPHQR